MSLLDFFKGRGKTPDRPPDIPVTRADDGEVIYSDELVSHIKAELERRRSERAAYELQWTLNANFLAGHQNCDIDMVSNTVCVERPVYKADRERRVYNSIAPLMETRHANLKSVRYDMAVNPRTNEDDDVSKARISTKLLEYCQANTNFGGKKDQLISWMELCGTAFTLSWWDKNAGDTIAREISETVSDSGEVIRNERNICDGDLAFGLLSAYEVFPHSLEVEKICDQHDIIVEQVFDVSQIYDKYGIEVSGEETEVYTLSPLPTAMTGHGRANCAFGVDKTTRSDCAKVITYYENPSSCYPDGRLIIIVGDRLVHMGTLPAGVMPIVAYKAKPVAGLFYGKSVIQDLIPLQRTYNNIKNKIVDYIATVANAPWLVPRGSMDVLDLGMNGIESGAILEYNSDIGAKPEPVQYPNPPSILMSEETQILQDMERTAGVSQLMVYGAAASSSSGKALDTRREIDTTRMSLTADNLRDGTLEMAKIWLKLNKAYSSGYRAVCVSGKDEMGAVYTWTSDDINSYDVYFTVDNDLRYSKEKQREDFVAAYQLGLFTSDDGRISQEFKRKAWELFRVGNLDNVAEIDDLQRMNAVRENSYFESGVVPQRYKYDDDEIHIREHMKYVLSNDFRLFRAKSPEYAEMIDAHIAEHANVIKDKQAAQVQAAQTAMMQNNKGGK